MSIISQFHPVSPIDGQPSRLSVLELIWQRSARRVVATAKRVYPTVLVFSIFTVLLIATMALRVAIWVPMWLPRCHETH